MLEIRQATLGDAAALGDILSCSWRAAYKGIVPDVILDLLTPESRAAVFISLFAKGEGEISIAHEDGQAAGFVITGDCRDDDIVSPCGEIWSIYLKPEYWRRAIGSKLITLGIEQLKAKGYANAALWVIEGNANAIAFYEKHGFKPDGARKAIEIGKTLYEARYVRGI